MINKKAIVVTDNRSFFVHIRCSMFDIGHPFPVQYFVLKRANDYSPLQYVFILNIHRLFFIPIPCFPGTAGASPAFSPFSPFSPFSCFPVSLGPRAPRPHFPRFPVSPFPRFPVSPFPRYYRKPTALRTFTIVISACSRAFAPPSVKTCLT